MNYLAHAVLSGSDPLWQLGGMLGDHVRGKAWQQFAAPVAGGILLHRRVDAFTDDHPAVRRARSRLQAPFRRYAGIILDIFFDHLLARNWQKFQSQDLQRFCQSIRDNLQRHHEDLPVSLQRFSLYMQHQELPESYRDWDVLKDALRRISHRLKRPVALDGALDQLRANQPDLGSDFRQLWSDLAPFAAREQQLLSDSIAEQPSGDGQTLVAGVGRNLGDKVILRNREHAE